MNFGYKPKEPEERPVEVILGSQSVGRRGLLERLGIRFRVIVTHVDESSITDDDPYKMLARRARAKADEIINNPRVYNLPEEGKLLVITADSMAVKGKKTYGKAQDPEDAKHIVKELMGGTHIFATATCITYIENGKEVKRYNDVVKTKVTLAKLPKADLDLYLSTYDFTRYAAGYALNDAPWTLVTKVDGSYTNVIGLPFEVLLPILRKVEVIGAPAE